MRGYKHSPHNILLLYGVHIALWCIFQCIISFSLWWTFWNPWHWRCNEHCLWTYSLNNSNYMHKAQLTIHKSQSQPSTIVLPTLTIQDLLNPVPVDNIKFPPSASTKELYRTMFDEGNDDKSHQQAPKNCTVPCLMRAMMTRASQSPLFKVPTSNVLWLRLLLILSIQSWSCNSRMLWQS